ncbi:MAG: RNA polymerase sigma-54 factor, partial [Candidatus Omnitrophica bacterium]|nr:RNA polymerase sigma-54 factor [Candidatus Omnitrophota bacterium]
EETMCRVTDFILNFHKNEVIENIDEIRSLTIKDVSTALNLHPSTINRAVSNKYIEINNKVIPLKNLLSHAVKKENGEHTSKVAVKKRIEEIIKSEDKREPLSDQAILEILSKEGIIIKRRTIAKYRNALRILPTYLRKKVA